jgi:AcrR family transcriptional regulator
MCPTLRTMPSQARNGRYHHGDLRAALIGTAIEIIAERGVRGFSVAEASRRLGVAVSAPYAHFADRDGLLAAVAVHAHELFYAELVPGMGQFSAPAERLAELARRYVRFAATHRPLFEVLYEAGLDKVRYPEIEAAARPTEEALMTCVRALSDGQGPAEELASALEATASGHVVLFFDGHAQQDEEAVAQAAERAARATLALIESRHLLAPAPSA